MISNGLVNPMNSGNSTSTPRRKRSNFQNLEDQINNLKDKKTGGLSRSAQNIQNETARKKAENAKQLENEAGKIQYDKPKVDQGMAPIRKQVGVGEEDYQKIADRLMPDFGMNENVGRDQWNPDFSEYLDRFGREYENLQGQLGKSVDTGSANYLNDLQQKAALFYQNYLDELENQRSDESKRFNDANDKSSDYLNEFKDKGEWLGNNANEGSLETRARQTNQLLANGSNLDAISALSGRYTDPRFAAIDQQLYADDIAQARGEAVQANKNLESAEGATDRSANQYEKNIQNYMKDQSEGVQEEEKRINEYYDKMRKEAEPQDMDKFKDELTGKTRSILDKMIENETTRNVQKNIQGSVYEMYEDVKKMLDNPKKGKWEEGRVQERLNSMQKLRDDLANSKLPESSKKFLLNDVDDRLNSIKEMADNFLFKNNDITNNPWNGKPW